jgi:Domain of unknown function (DUF4262)
MISENPRKEALDSIRANISRDGHHLYVVSGGPTPRFAYTIGLSESIGAELIFAGAVFYYSEEVSQIVTKIASQLKREGIRETTFDIDRQGSFTNRKVHNTWTTELMLGALDYYKKRDISAVQIVPDKAHWTIDVPDMSAPWNATKEPVWRWLREDWTYPVPKDSTAATNLDALRGGRVTEIMRWEEDEWEIFAGAGPDVSKEDMRVVPLGTLIAADRTVEAAVRLTVGEGIWRDSESKWHPWHKRENANQ